MHKIPHDFVTLHQKIPVCATPHSQDPQWREDLFLCVVEGTEATLAPFQHDLLHAQEKKRFEEMHYPRRRQSYLLGRYAAKKALQGAVQGDWQEDWRYRDPSRLPLEIWIQSGLLGEPFIEGRSQALSIAHGGTYGIAIVGSGRVSLGIDIEPLILLRNLTADALSVSESHLISTCGVSVEESLGIFWTAKEALAKCLGVGLSVPFSLFEVGHMERWGSVTWLTFSNFPAFQGCVWKFKESLIALSHRG